MNQGKQAKRSGAAATAIAEGENASIGQSLAKVERQSTRVKKDLFLDAYRKSWGVVKAAAYYSGVHRDTYYDWVKSDPEFCKELEYVLWDINSIAEDKLMELIMQGHAPSIRFYLSRRHPDYKRKTAVVEKPAPVETPIRTIEDLLHINQR